MDSSSGVSVSISISSNSSGVQTNSGSEEDLQVIMEERKRKRMISNRESARRSRLRKQKHLDGLMAQVAQLRHDNQQIAATWNRTSQQHANVESENAILRTQVAELTHRLHSLNDIIACLTAQDDNPPPPPPPYDFSWNCFSQSTMLAAAAVVSADPGFMY